MAEQKYLCDRCVRYPCSENETKLMTLCPAYSPKPKPTTNADRIRAMSDEKLANWLCAHSSCHNCEGVGNCMDGLNGWLDWLQSPADGGDGGC